MKNLSHHLIIVCICCCFCGLKAEETVHGGYSYRRYTTQDGLPQMLTECLYQDSHGFIWTGTLSGFARYDGITFETYLKGKEENIIRINENATGEVRGFAFRRSYTIDTGGDSLRVEQQSTGNLYLNHVNSRLLPSGYAIYEKGDGSDKALYLLSDTGLVERFRHTLLDELGDIRQLYWEPAARLFFIPTAKGIYEVGEGGGVVRLHEGISVYTFIIYSGQLWAAAADGLYRREGHSFERAYPYDFDYSFWGLNACVNGDGILLISDQKNIYQYENGAISLVYQGMNFIRDMMVDKEGNLWVATYQGLYNFFRLQFHNYTLADEEDVVRALAAAGDGRTVYAGTLEGKLLEFAGDEAANVAYPPNPSAPRGDDNYFSPSPVATGGRSYFPAYGGVLTVEGDRRRWMNIPFQNYQVVAEGRDGNLLLGNRLFLQEVSPDGEVLRTIRDEIPQHGIHCAGYDRDGRLWIGGVKGIAIIAGDSVVRLADEDIRLCSIMIKAPGGDLWFACENRLYVSEGDSARLVTSFDHLIRSVLVTSTGYLIVATVNGIHLLDKEAASVMFYNQYNGYMGIEPMKTGMTEDKDGNVWMASINMLTRFNPHQLLYKQAAPKLYLEPLAASGNDLKWKTTEGGTVKLGHTFCNLRFRYIGVSHSAADNVRYQYKLSGLQNEWSQPTPEREVTFNNLKSGLYEFQLKANAGLPDTDTDVLSCSILITPAFWQTGWFLSAAFFVLVGSIAFFIYQYLQKRNARQMETLAREIQLNDLRIKSIRLKSIPHFNSNVLAGIEYYIMNFSKEEANQYLSLYSQFSNKTLQDVDKASRSLEEELEYVELYLKLEKLRFEARIEYRIEVGEAVDRQIAVPNMVLHTYCENAVKHGLLNKAGRGNILIRAAGYDEGVVISVEDDGIGREAAADAKTVSTKQGLPILMQQIQLYNERNERKMHQEIIDLKDEAGKACGTRFELYVPAGFTYI